MVDELFFKLMMEGIVKFFENGFDQHNPEVQAPLIHFAKQMSLKLDEWARSKLERKGQ